MNQQKWTKEPLKLSEAWVLVDTRQRVGNSVFFWRKNAMGYTCEFRGAHLFSKDDAIRIEKGGDKFKAFPYREVVKLVQHHIDFQDLYSEQLREKPHPLNNLPEQEDRQIIDDLNALSGIKNPEEFVKRAREAGVV